MRSELDALVMGERQLAEVVQESLPHQGPKKGYLKAPQLLHASPQLIAFARSWVSSVRSILAALVIRGLLGYVLAGVPHLKVLNRAEETNSICTSVENTVDQTSCVTCDVLYEPPGGEDAIHADVIFIHGLHGSLVNTWRQGRWRSKYSSGVPRIILRPVDAPIDVPQGSVDDRTDEHCAVGCTCPNCYSSCWPKDWLPMDCPNARVIALNYTTDPYLWRPIWIRKKNRTCLQHRADEMVSLLKGIGVGEKPIVWVGHSKGGLFIKQMYAEAYEQMIYERTRTWDKKTDSWSRNGSPQFERSFSNNSINLWLNTKAFLFYSVPHRGSALAGIRSPLLARSVELLEIEKDSESVLELQNRWLKAIEAARNLSQSSDLLAESISEWEVDSTTEELVLEKMVILGDMKKNDQKRPHVVSFVETVKTLMSVLWLTIVSVESADAGVGVLCGVPLDHREICKPSGRKCFLYRELVHMIQAATNDDIPPIDVDIK